MNTSIKNFPRIYGAIGIIIVLLLVLQYIRPPVLKRVFFVDYKALFEKSKTVEIASFQTGEAWRGDFTLDTERSFDGETGLNFYSMNGRANSITLSKGFNLSPVDTINLFIFSKENNISADIDSLLISFASSKKDSFESSIKLEKQGWNFISLPRSSFTKSGNPDWKKIQAVSLNLVSKKSSTVQLSVDRIWGEKGNIPNPMIDSKYDQFLNLKTVEGNTFLHMGASELFPLIIRKADEGNRFAYIISFIPLKHKAFCSAFNFSKLTDDGYLFCVEGSKMNTWTLLKQNGKKRTLLSEGTLHNTSFEKNAYAWIRVEKDGSSIKTGVSFNGTAFETVSNMKDSSFNKGTLGILAEGSYLINTIEVLK